MKIGNLKWKKNIYFLLVCFTWFSLSLLVAVPSPSFSFLVLLLFVRPSLFSAFYIQHSPGS